MGLSSTSPSLPLLILAVSYLSCALMAMLRLFLLLKWQSKNRVYGKQLVILLLLLICGYSLRTTQSFIWFSDLTCGEFPPKPPIPPMCWRVTAFFIAPFSDFFIFSSKLLVFSWFVELSFSLELVFNSYSGRRKENLIKKWRRGVICILVCLIAVLIVENVYSFIRSGQIEIVNRNKQGEEVEEEGEISETFLRSSSQTAASSTDSPYFLLSYWRYSLSISVWLVSLFYIFAARKLWNALSALRVSKEIRKPTKFSIIITVSLCIISTWAKGLIIMSFLVWPQFVSSYNENWELSDLLQLFSLEIIPLCGVLTFRRNSLLSQFHRGISLPKTIKKPLMLSPPAPVL